MGLLGEGGAGRTWSVGCGRVEVVDDEDGDRVLFGDEVEGEGRGGGGGGGSGWSMMRTEIVSFLGMRWKPSGWMAWRKASARSSSGPGGPPCIALVGMVRVSSKEPVRPVSSTIWRSWMNLI